MQGIREVIDFWFSERARERWFAPSPEFDQTVRKRFAELFARAATGELRDWANSAEGSLALCILLDQFPRNMFRGDARAFGTDDKALRVAEHALAQGYDHGLEPEQKQFLYLPFMHSETLSNQLRALALFEQAKLPTGRRYAEEHVQIIRRFGRFPHRNELLGRISTEDEIRYLKEGGATYGQEAGRRPTRGPRPLPAPASAGDDSRSTPRSAP